MNALIIPKRYLAMSRTVAGRVPKVLAGRGLEPAFSDWCVTAHRDRVWLFGVLDVARTGRLERYTDPATLHHLSTALRGVPVLVSNTNGLRYAFLLTRRPRLPRRVEVPTEPHRGKVLVGVGAGNATVALPWDDLGHVLVAGMTRSGKSNFLRLLAWQAVREGSQLLLADLDGRTFPMLTGNPAMLAPVAGDAVGVREVVARALGECDRRAALYAGADGFPETLQEYNANRGERDPLPRLLVVLDEFNAAVTTLGGARGALAGEVAQLAWRGLKFGVSLVFAAQDLSKGVVGRVRDQVRTAVCFKVQGAELARAVGCAGAQNIPASLPGRAMTDRWGPLQTFYLDKSLLIGDVAPVLTLEEGRLVTWALRENGGYLARADVEARGWAHREARRLLSGWERRGWLAKDPNRGNCRHVTEELAALAAQAPNLPNAAQVPSRSPRRAEG